MQVFEKSHRAGGRASTRIADGECQFDHGAQYFTIRDPELKPYLESWCQDEHVALWDGQIVSIEQPGSFRDVPSMKRFVGTPSMESLGTHLASDLKIAWETQVAKVERESSGFRLTSKTGSDLDRFDVVLWNCPPVQVENMLPLQCEWRDQLSKVEMVPCWSIMLAFEDRWTVPFDGAFVNDGSLGWIARDSSKPSRPKKWDTWVLHSTVAWASDHVDIAREMAIQSLMHEAERVTRSTMPAACIVKAHRWLYSRPTESLSQRSLWDETHRLGACGDWCGGPRVEGALRSGMAMAGQVLGSLHERTLVNAAAHKKTPGVVQLELFP
jgi:predicted NAD/FAD-dependent oxidoreductase